MRFSVLSLFPEALEPYVGTSILARGSTAGLTEYNLVNIRDFATDKHQTVDDTPYGGGAGMVMKVEPIHRALESLPAKKNRHVVVMSARGRQFTQSDAERFASLDELVLIAGRYEGIDQRVADHLADEELSVGPYVLAGGELPALTIIEATARLIPGVLGNPESLTEESHSASEANPEAVSAEYPQYTKPETYNEWDVPDVLLSGNHAAIEAWRKDNSA